MKEEYKNYEDVMERIGELNSELKELTSLADKMKEEINLKHRIRDFVLNRKSEKIYNKYYLSNKLEVYDIIHGALIIGIGDHLIDEINCPFRVIKKINSGDKTILKLLGINPTRALTSYDYKPINNSKVNNRLDVYFRGYYEDELLEFKGHIPQTEDLRKIVKESPYGNILIATGFSYTAISPSGSLFKVCPNGEIVKEDDLIGGKTIVPYVEVEIPRYPALCL